jgi:hypothetical protein
MDVLGQRSRQFWLVKLITLFCSIVIIVVALSKAPWLALPVTFILFQSHGYPCIHAWGGVRFLSLVDFSHSMR